jgi:hypothetical protein
VSRKDALNQSLDRASAKALQAVLWVPGSSRLRQSLLNRNAELPDKHTFRTWFIARIVPLLCLAFAISFITNRLLEYGNWPPKVYLSDEVFNLTHEKIQWDIHYGPHRGCQDRLCYVNPSTPASYFVRRDVLPLREFPLRDWRDDQVVYYRATVQIPERVLKGTYEAPLSLHTILMFAKSWDFYVNETLVFQGVQETMLAPIPRHFIAADGTVRLAIIANVNKLPYQGIANRGDLVIGPRNMLAPLSFFARDNNTSLQLIYLLPKLTFCVVFSILFFFMRSNQEIAWFLIYGITSSLELFFRSDYAQQFGIPGETTELLALMTRNYALLAFARFIYAFFRLQSKGIIRFMDGLLVVLTLVNAACLTMAAYASATKVLDIIAIILKPGVYLFSIVLALIMAGLLSTEARSRVRSRIALSFGILLTVGTFLAFIDLTKLVTSTFGISLQLTIVNLTWVFDLILFVFMAIVTGLQLAVQHTQQQQITDKLQSLNDRLELASTVQSTLLPNPMYGQRGSIQWHCYYVAAERLAGDWVFMSEDRHHPTRFYLGDVTGKGPAAAIAVAAIVSLLRKKDFEPSTITSTMKELNKHLFHLFRGNASSAVCMAEVSDDGQTKVTSHAMMGWMHLSPGKARMVQTRGSILGTSDHLDVTMTETTLAPGDYLICFSDGCLEGQRHLRRLGLHLEKQNLQDLTADELFKIVIKVGQDSVLPDDKAMLVIHKCA